MDSPIIPQAPAASRLYFPGKSESCLCPGPPAKSRYGSTRAAAHRMRVSVCVCVNICALDSNPMVGTYRNRFDRSWNWTLHRIHRTYRCKDPLGASLRMTRTVRSLTLKSIAGERTRGIGQIEQTGNPFSRINR